MILPVRSEGERKDTLPLIPSASPINGLYAHVVKHSALSDEYVLQVDVPNDYNGVHHIVKAPTLLDKFVEIFKEVEAYKQLNQHILKPTTLLDKFIENFKELQSYK